MDVFTCSKCRRKFKKKSNFSRHHRVCRYIVKYCPLCGEDNCTKNSCRRESPPFDVNIPRQILAVPEGVEKFEENWSAIQTGVRTNGARVSIVNIRLPTGELSDAVDTMRQIHITQRFRYKVGLSVGLILQHVEEATNVRYFHASQNNACLLDPLPTVTNTETLEELLSFMGNCITFEEVRKLCETDTKFKVLSPTNVNVCIYKGPGEFPIGGRGVPNIRKRQLPGTLDFPYTDRLCVFRCISFHLYKTEKRCVELLHRYDPKANPKTFKGLYPSEFSKLENLFDIQIAVYTVRKVKGGSKLKARVSLFQPPSKLTSVNGKVNLHLASDRAHVSLITGFDTYAGIHECSACKAAFTTQFLLKRHRSQLSPCTQVKLKYKGGVYQNTQSVFEELADIAILPPNENLKIYPYKVTFDFEAFFKTPTDAESTEHVTVMAEHWPLSASVASDFPGRTGPVCFVRESDKESDPLLERVLNYINDTAKLIGRTVMKSYQPMLNALDVKIAEAVSRELKITPTTKDPKRDIFYNHPLVKLKKKFLRFILQVPVIGFNSGRYDLNLIKIFFHKYFSTKEESKFFSVIKRNNQYLAIYTKHTVFLDVVNYLAPGYSYENYLSAFTKNAHKGFFPYEWLTSVKKLRNKTLPPRSAFHSKLTGRNISESDYRQCQKVWTEQNMKTFKDYLIYYNNKDVEPFVTALNNHARFFRERGLDMFKDGISLPGLTLRFLFKDIDTPYVTFHQHDAHLHALIQKNLVGGPSIIFHRFHEKNSTRIREHKYGAEAKTCQHILGVDANSLYLRCMSEAHCTGYYLVRRLENEFKAETRQRTSKVALEWLRHIEHAHSVRLRHAFNGGEVQIGCKRIRVDGFHPPSRTVFQFHGCWFHAHDCIPSYRFPCSEERDERRSRTERVRKYLNALGYTVIVIWECEWHKRKKENPQVIASREHWRVDHINATRNPMTESEVLSSVQREDLFGLLLVDIETPPHLYDYFEEMTPIFKNTQISKSDIGSHMQAFVEKGNLLSTPQKSLIGSYRGEKILLGSPLLKWYLDHGLIVTKLHLFIQYFPQRTFAKFADEVTTARRRGDVNATEKILSDCYKLMGNSSYGKTICNKEKHTRVSYTKGRTFELWTNSWRFKRGSELDSDLYEVELQPKNVTNNLPIQIGFMVYQYAKLKMLEFTFDFLDKFFDRRDYALCQMDTDSLYMALSGVTLDELVKPDLREVYLREKRNWLPTAVCDEHLDEFVEKSKSKGAQNWCPPPCCQSRYVHDQRTPGLFKYEWEGDGILSLNSKTYMCYNKNTMGERESKKWSAKGVVKKQNVKNPEDFLSVLSSEKPVSAVNMNFKLIDNKMHTYTIEKTGLSYLYIKRKVHSDGVTTSPLSL